MNRVKYTSTTTGTGNITLSLVSGFQDIADSINTYADSTSVLYTLLDGGGSSWEVGYGTISGTTLSRADSSILESTNSDNRISLSAGTHTVLINRSFYEGHIITQGYILGSGGSMSVSANSSANVSFDTVMGNYITSQPVSGLTSAPGRAGNGISSIIGDPTEEIPYARACRYIFSARCSDNNSGSMFGVAIDPDQYGYPLVANWAPQNGMMSGGNIATVTSPIFRNRSPWGESNYGYIPYGVFDFKIYNTDVSNSITVYPELIIEIYL